jgi:hypothetical protein
MTMADRNGPRTPEPTPRTRRVIAAGYVRRGPLSPAAARMQALRESIAHRILTSRHMTDARLLDVARVRSIILLTVRHPHGDRPYSIYAFRQATPIECDPGLANPSQPGDWISIHWRDGQYDDLPHLTADITTWAHHHAATRIAHLHRRTADHYRQTADGHPMNEPQTQTQRRRLVAAGWVRRAPEPEQDPSARLAALHRLCRADYQQAAPQRTGRNRRDDAHPIEAVHAR